MSLFKKSPPPPVHEVRTRASDRFSTISKGEVLDWVDSALASSWKALEDYRKDPDISQLEDTEQGLQMVLGAVDDLRRREQSL